MSGLSVRRLVSRGGINIGANKNDIGVILAGFLGRGSWTCIFLFSFVFWCMILIVLLWHMCIPRCWSWHCFSSFIFYFGWTRLWRVCLNLLVSFMWLFLEARPCSFYLYWLLCVDCVVHCLVSLVWCVCILWWFFFYGGATLVMYVWCKPTNFHISKRYCNYDYPNLY